MVEPLHQVVRELPWLDKSLVHSEGPGACISVSFKKKGGKERGRCKLMKTVHAHILTKRGVGPRSSPTGDMAG